jgi:hypothetical protein
MYDIEFAHNTCVVEMGSKVTRLFELGGCCTTRRACWYGNIIYFSGNTTAAVYEVASRDLQYFRGDGNIYWNPAVKAANLGIGRSSTTATPWNLTNWRSQVTNQEKASQVVDPLLLKAKPPYIVPQGFNVVPASPAIDKAVSFPGYATFPADPVETDYNGRYRDDKPDVGAFEGSGFATFGTGCPGTNKKVPQMGYNGTVAIPSPGFQATVKDGKPSAPSFLVVGHSLTSWRSITLPFDLGGNCELITGLTLTFPKNLGANGAATQPVPIPNISLLVGNSVYLQWLIADSASASPFMLTTSDGGAINF